MSKMLKWWKIQDTSSVDIEMDTCLHNFIVFDDDLGTVYNK